MCVVVGVWRLVRFFRVMCFCVREFVFDCFFGEFVGVILFSDIVVCLWVLWFLEFRDLYLLLMEVFLVYFCLVLGFIDLFLKSWIISKFIGKIIKFDWILIIILC